MGRMSGIATLTRRYVDAVAGTRAVILDTRKTTPGLRDLEKYSVRCGGGASHRRDLSSMVLITENHIAVFMPVEDVFKRAVKAGTIPGKVKEAKPTRCLAPTRSVSPHRSR